MSCGCVDVTVCVPIRVTDVGVRPMNGAGWTFWFPRKVDVGDVNHLEINVNVMVSIYTWIGGSLTMCREVRLPEISGSELCSLQSMSYAPLDPVSSPAKRAAPHSSRASGGVTAPGQGIEQGRESGLYMLDRSPGRIIGGVIEL